LFATSSDGQIARATVRVTSNKTAPRITWKPLPSGSIEGLLVDGLGQPMPGIDLFVAAKELQNAVEEPAGDRMSSTVLTDRNGRFRCRGLLPGTWTVVGLHEPGVESATGDVTKDNATNVVLRLAR
jgi:uncharacterized GH25 family protein